VSAFEEAFGLPAGHSLRLVHTALRGEVRKWEHEEQDARGALVAIYESWSRGANPPEEGLGAGGGFVKYSPHGWVLRRSMADARPGRARPGEEGASPPTHRPPSLRRTVERWST
jgi:hypothetical protein